MRINETLYKFIQEQNKEFHRFKSWQHSYEFFQKKYFINPADTCENDDLAALNLGFYLSSWGMYRGSTFLLQNDYKIHINVVKYLKKNYKECHIYDFDEIKEIKEKIFVEYRKVNEKYKATDTLITKILLGTYACVPAYDRFFIKGFKIIMEKNCGLNENNIQELNDFYEKNIKEFEKFEKNFPRMKLLDMYFWKVGYDKSLLDKEKSAKD